MLCMNKKTLLLGIIIGAIIFLPLGIFATMSYDASQINYKSTTLDHAIDELYTTQNTTVTNLQTNLNTCTNKEILRKLILRLYGTQANTSRGTANLLFDGSNIVGNYNRYKITSLVANKTGLTCAIRSYSRAKSAWQDLSLNTTYKILDSSDGYNYDSIMIAASGYNGYAECQATVEIFNE